MYAIAMYKKGEKTVLTHRYVERTLAERMTVFLSKRVENARFLVMWMGNESNGGNTHED